MIYFPGRSFNAQYLLALQSAVGGAETFEESRVGEVINLEQAFFEIAPDDPRLVFLKGRKLNAVFAMVEAAWILSGSNELAPLRREITHYGNYSDDGVTLNGAYGYRLRSFYGVDQIERAIEILSREPHSRRVVLSLYDIHDLGSTSRDIPCNTSVFLKVRGGGLDLTVINRSNDIYMGLPYNVFVFGILQLYLARALGLRVGVQRHFIDSLHLYRTQLEKARDILASNESSDLDRLSTGFDWDYANSIIDDAVPILNGRFGEVSDDALRLFLTGEEVVRESGDEKTHATRSRFFAFLVDRVIGRCGKGST